MFWSQCTGSYHGWYHGWYHGERGTRRYCPGRGGVQRNGVERNEKSQKQMIILEALTSCRESQLLGFFVLALMLELRISSCQCRDQCKSEAPGENHHPWPKDKLRWEGGSKKSHIMHPLLYLTKDRRQSAINGSIFECVLFDMCITLLFNHHVSKTARHSQC